MEEKMKGKVRRGKVRKHEAEEMWKDRRKKKRQRGRNKGEERWKEGKDLRKQEERRKGEDGGIHESI